MRFESLMEDLIDVSKTRKADLASALSYSPGELSRFLSGQRLPPPANADFLVDTSAAFFADTIWDNGRSHGLRKIFPIRRVFTDKNDLTYSLKNALSLALQNSYMDRRDENRIYASPVILCGWKDIVSHVLIRLSTALYQGKDLQVYITRELFWWLFINEALQVLDDGSQPGKLHMNVLLDEDAAAEYLNLKTLQDIVERTLKLSPVMDFSAWKTSQAKPEMFMLIGDDTLLLVNDMIPDAPIATLVHDKSHIMRFTGFCRRLFETSVCRSAEQVCEYVMQYRAEIMAAADTCEGIYLFSQLMPIFRADDLTAIDAPEELKTFVGDVFQTMLNRSVPFIWTTQAQDRLLASRDIVVPLLGHLTLNSKEDLECFADRLLSLRTSSMKLGKISHDSPPFAMFVLKDDVLIYLPGSKTADELFCLLPKSICQTCLTDLDALISRSIEPDNTDLVEKYLRSLPEKQ